MSGIGSALRSLRAVRRLVRLSAERDERGRLVLPLVRFVKEWLKYRDGALGRAGAMRADFADIYPIVGDYDAPAGEVTYYFHQDLWAARKIYAARPSRHVDVGSRIDGFVAHVLAFMPVEYVDIRPLPNPVEGLNLLVADATRLEGIADDSVISLSSLSAAEHFGLGRYSDPIDPDACFHFMDALCRVLAPGGRLYFSVPVGSERVEFNAHRIFSAATILDRFAALRLESFAYVDEADRLHEGVDPARLPPGTETFAALFEFSKPLRP